MIPPEPVQAVAPKSVLVIPDVFPADFRKELIDLWEKQGNFDSVSLLEKGGEKILTPNYDRKIRRDHYVENGSAVHLKICEYLSRALPGKIKQHMNIQCGRMEQIKIACYGPGGFLRAHRDNSTAGTASRLVAVSLLLTDDYEGGDLRFPELGGASYHPPAGAAVVFRTSLLHEVTNVVAGRRFAVLTFLHA
jgi:predicted 2-oxoglutarate/Fe(II)-dependent dioxygenase YbiX